MDSNQSHESLGKPLANIIIMMRNIGFTTSPDRTTIKPESIRETIEQMEYYLPTIFS